MFFLGWVLSITLLLLGCQAPIHNADNSHDRSPKWTVENPNASSGMAKGSALAADPRRDTAAPVSTSSLDALRTGESTATTASSPMKDVNFAFDSHELTPDARQILKGNADWLKANPATRAQIEGHCDDRGTVEYNLALGAKRAKVVKDYLVTLGVMIDRLSDISYGEEIPVCKEQTEACWEKNRRARFVIASAGPTS
jgi:peptidoglycan-associated lipoprotein